MVPARFQCEEGLTTRQDDCASTSRGSRCGHVLGESPVCLCLALSLPPRLSPCLSPSLSVCRCLSLCVFPCLCLSLSLCLPVCLSICLCLSISVCLSVSPSVSVSLSLRLSLSLSVSLCLSVRLSVCLSVSLSLLTLHCPPHTINNHKTLLCSVMHSPPFSVFLRLPTV